MITDIREMLQTTSETICLSGGATGADSLWSRIAQTHGIDTIHFSYEGHKKYCRLAKGVRVVVPQAFLNLADPFLMKAKKRNNRSWPCRSLDVSNLLRRNYYQVVDAQSCYAVSRLIYGVVDGGTSWAVSMFIDKWVKEHPFEECPCYVYDTITSHWYQWVFNAFEPVDHVPTPTGIWTGIGSRELTPAAERAMEALWPM